MSQYPPNNGQPPNWQEQPLQRNQFQYPPRQTRGVPPDQSSQWGQQQPPPWQGQPPSQSLSSPTSYQQLSGPAWPQPPSPSGNLLLQHQRQPIMPPGPPPVPPRRKLSRRTWIITGVIVLILIIVSAVNVSKGSDRPTAAALTATPMTINSQATDTLTPKSTFTPKSTLTSSALTDTVAIATQLQSDINHLALAGDSITVDYDNHAIVFVGLHQQPTESSLVAMVQSECFSVQKTVWQDPLLHNVNWLDYSVKAIGSQGLPVVLGECILHAQTAASIHWDNYDATSAWQQKIYENMLLK